MSERVSIIIPVFNTGSYLNRCVNSVLEQDYDNIEIILVEDGSTDNSREICRAIASANSNVILITHECNLGQEATRNDGLDIANGEWIYFLDSDDTISPGTISKLVEVGAKKNADIVLCNFKYVKKGHEEIVKADFQEGLYSSKEIIEYMMDELSWEMVSCIGSKFYRASVLDENKIRFDAQYKFNEDGAFALKALSCASIICYVNLEVYNYMIREANSIQSSYRENMFFSISSVYKLLRTIYIQYGSFEKRCNRLYCQQVTHIFVCLKNEIEFRSYSDYKELYLKILNDTFYLDACKKIKKKYSLSKWLFAKLFMFKFFFVIYAYIKIKR